MISTDGVWTIIVYTGYHGQVNCFIFSCVVVWLRLIKPRGMRVVIAENIALRQQLIVLARHHKRVYKLTAFDRILFGFLTSMMTAKQLLRVAIVLKPATLLKFHKALVQRKYHLLFSRKTPRKPGPKGPKQAVVDAIIEMKKHNPSYGQRRIAMQISNIFGIAIDKDTVRRVFKQILPWYAKR